MSYRKISQREARAAMQELAELKDRERQRGHAWRQDYPGGVHIDTLKVTNTEWFAMTVARKLGHALVLVPGDDDRVRVYGVSP